MFYHLAPKAEEEKEEEEEYNDDYENDEERTFNNTIKTFYLRLNGVRYIILDHR